MRGRKPMGPEYVAGLEGSAQAKERLQAVLETMTGTCRVQEACARLGLSEPRFRQIRAQGLGAAVRELEPRPAGRPPRSVEAAAEQVRALEEHVVALEVALRAARVRAELALALPQVAHEAAAPEKKTRRRTGKGNSSRPWQPPTVRSDT